MPEAFEQATGKTIDNWRGYLRWLAVHRRLDRIRSNKRVPTTKVHSGSKVGLNLASTASLGSRILSIQASRSCLAREDIRVGGFAFGGL